MGTGVPSDACWKLRSDAATDYPFLSFPAFSDPGKAVRQGAVRDKKIRLTLTGFSM